MTNNKRRKSDFQPQQIETIITVFWRKYAPYWHVCMFALTIVGAALFWYFTVNNAIAQTNLNTQDIDTLKQAVYTMKGEIDGMAEVLGVKKPQNIAGAR